jgi:hypothetical protein
MDKPSFFWFGYSNGGTYEIEICNTGSCCRFVAGGSQSASQCYWPFSFNTTITKKAKDKNNGILCELTF